MFTTVLRVTRTMKLITHQTIFAKIGQLARKLKQANILKAKKYNKESNFFISFIIFNKRL